MCELEFNPNEVVKISFNKFTKKYDLVADTDVVVISEEQLEDIVIAGEKLLYSDDRSYEELKEENEELKRIIEEQEEQFKELTEIAEYKGVAL
jgi:predicted nuclease with TOPRIM domain